MIHPLQKRLRRKLIDAAIEAGATTAQARDAAARVLPKGDGINWDWFLNGGFAQLLEALLLILRLFQGAPKAVEE